MVHMIESLSFISSRFAPIHKSGIEDHIPNVVSSKYPSEKPL